MITISLIDARRGLNIKCRELFKDERIAEDIYQFLCDGIEDCENVQPQRMRGKWIPQGWNDTYCRCSCCDAVYVTAEIPYNFCSNCGADMRETE